VRRPIPNNSIRKKIDLNFDVMNCFLFEISSDLLSVSKTTIKVNSQENGFIKKLIKFIFINLFSFIHLTLFSKVLAEIKIRLLLNQIQKLFLRFRSKF
jgi:hypothetical protein